jgi:hypothetical protein
MGQKCFELKNTPQSLLVVAFLRKHLPSNMRLVLRGRSKHRRQVGRGLCRDVPLRNAQWFAIYCQTRDADIEPVHRNDRSNWGTLSAEQFLTEMNRIV